MEAQKLLKDYREYLMSTIVLSENKFGELVFKANVIGNHPDDESFHQVTFWTCFYNIEKSSWTMMYSIDPRIGSKVAYRGKGTIEDFKIDLINKKLV